MRFLLDTSVYLQPLRPKPLPVVEQHWRELGDEALAISALTLAEARGLLMQRDSKKLWQLYTSFLEDKLTVLAYDEAVAVQMGDLIAQDAAAEHPRSQLDLIVAATARQHRLILATTRPQAYEGIAGLAVEDWSSESA
ncbi:MAG: type II toxin-antitoxin system VapC family toxin [Verrucomicrobiota bacterium]